MTKPDPETPAPKKSSRRQEGETRGRQFRRVARRIMRRRLMPQPHGGGALWLADTLDWLDLWQPGGTEVTEELPPATVNDHLSPRL